MRREGYIIDEIIKWDNLELSFDTVVRGKKRKHSREGRWLLKHRMQFLHQVKQQVLTGDIKLHKWHTKTIKEGGKIRNIQVFCMKDRILINAIMTIVDKHLKPRLIRTTSASIKGRGMHELKKYIVRDISTDIQNMRYFYKCDIKKFYDNINPELVSQCLRKLFKDKKLLKILDFFLNIMPHGLSIGMRSSQGFGNILMNYVIDHIIKDKLGVNHYYRYCDDILIGCATKRECWKLRNVCHELTQKANLTIKPNESVFPINKGINMLGYIIYNNHSILRKRTKQKFARKLKQIKSRRRRKELIGSFYGMAKHCNSKNLMKLLLNKAEMKKLSDLGIKYRSEDGKKQFDGETVKLSCLANKTIVVCDYESNIKTRYGENRCVIEFKYNEKDKKTYKFFTQSKMMRSILQQVDEQDGFPFETTIECTSGGNHTAYKFS